jgi:hypothetical protein
MAIAHSQGPPQPGVRNPCLKAEVGAIRLSVNSHMAIAHSQLLISRSSDYDIVR